MQSPEAVNISYSKRDPAGVTKCAGRGQGMMRVLKETKGLTGASELAA